MFDLQDPQPLETAINIEDNAKPESGATVITRSPCPYSGGNPELTGARFDPEPEEEYAIKFKSAFKHYGHGKGRTPVLLGLDMNVERGQIYGLLGKEETTQHSNWAFPVWPKRNLC